jgi:phosphonopyruvate decarboxylase
MINPKEFINKLKGKGYNPFVEVPCSSLASIIAEANMDPAIDLINPANEGIALGIAAGAFLAGKKPVLLIQNSGFLNTLNGLTSLNQIYELPVLYIISWRGFGKDAPEHEIVGRDMEKYFEMFNLAYSILEEDNYEESLDKADKYMTVDQKPYGFLVKPGIFEKLSSKTTSPSYAMERIEAIRVVKERLLKKGYTIISTNGFISRESYHIAPSPDFYMMGSMGHALPLGLGVARYSGKKIAVMDGDGAALMHLGALPSVGAESPKNLLHIILDNEVCASTGNQPTVSSCVNLDEIASKCGYKNVFKVIDFDGLKTALDKIVSLDGPSLLLIKVLPGNAKGIKRVSDDLNCAEIKNNFMEQIKDGLL